MMKLRETILLISLLMLAFSLQACMDDDSFTTSPQNRLTFSIDTLSLDTTFANVPTTTHSFWAYNRSGDGLRCASVRLASGNQTGFRVNVNGTYLGPNVGYQAQDVEIRDEDSIRIFVELTAPATGKTDPQRVIEVCRAIAPMYGGINLEDIAAPACFEIERVLDEELDIPVFHDDQWGTAVITVAGLINYAAIAKRDLGDLHVVINGAGAAGIRIADMCKAAGVKDLTMCDSKGIIRADRTDLTEHKRRHAVTTDKRTLQEALAGAHVFIGVSAAGVLSGDGAGRPCAHHQHRDEGGRQPGPRRPRPRARPGGGAGALSHRKAGLRPQLHHPQGLRQAPLRDRLLCRGRGRGEVRRRPRGYRPGGGEGASGGRALRWSPPPCKRLKPKPRNPR